MASSDSISDMLTHLTLTEVQRQCQDARNNFKRTKDSATDSRSCAEIIRRAAAKDEEALGVLIYDISYQRITDWCRSKLRTFGIAAHDVDDVRQEVGRRLVGKLYNGREPFRPCSLAEYYGFLWLTTLRCVIDMRTQQNRAPSTALTPPPARSKKKGDKGTAINNSQTVALQQAETGHPHPPESLDRLLERGVEPMGVMFTDEVERRMCFERYLELLPEPLMRETFRRRFGLEESPGEVAQALGLTKDEIFRNTERAIRVLSTNPEIRDMLAE